MNIIKIGGSIITYKRSDSAPPYRWKESNLHYRIKDNSIRSIAEVIGNYVENGLILVHGGGTHGHRTVKRWETGAAKGKECQRVWEVKWRMLQLTERIVHIMGEMKVPVVAISPSDIIELDGRSIKKFNPEPIQKLLDHKCIPMLRGDLAPNSEGGWSVVSGDEIMVELVRKGTMNELPRIRSAVMCLDIDGFYRGLGEPDQELLGSVGPDDYHSSFSEWKENIRSSKEKGDVSGGVLRKVEACHRIAAMGTNSWMIGGRIDVSLSKVLSGESSGTLFKGFNGNQNCIDGKCGGTVE
jgi:isopentenyl phosphate kinase